MYSKIQQQSFVPVKFHYGSGYDFNLLYSELFKQNTDKTKLDNIPLASGKSKIVSIDCIKFLDSCNFLAMPQDQMTNLYGCKTKTLYPYEHFSLDSLGRASDLGSSIATKSYSEFIDSLKIEDIKSYQSNNLAIQEEVNNFNKDNSQKSGKDLTIEYLQNVRLLHE